MKRAILTLALLLALPATAQTVLSGFLTRHSHNGYCERNHGIGVRIDSGEWKNWAVGTYRNSLCRQSVYIAREWQYGSGPVRMGLIAGAVTGYRAPIMPALLPEVVVQLGRAEVAFVVQPFEIKQSPAFVGLQVRWRFGGAP